jgi:hypothetical protein
MEQVVAQADFNQQSFIAARSSSPSSAMFRDFVLVSKIAGVATLSAFARRGVSAPPAKSPRLAKALTVATKDDGISRAAALGWLEPGIPKVSRRGRNDGS